MALLLSKIEVLRIIHINNLFSISLSQPNVVVIRIEFNICIGLHTESILKEHEWRLVAVQKARTNVKFPYRIPLVDQILLRFSRVTRKRQHSSQRSCRARLTIRALDSSYTMRIKFYNTSTSYSILAILSLWYNCAALMIHNHSTNHSQRANTQRDSPILRRNCIICFLLSPFLRYSLISPKPKGGFFAPFIASSVKAALRLHISEAESVNAKKL